MTQHTTTADNQIYTCAACSFKAVQTTRGLFLLDPGDDKQQHLDAITAQQAERREWVVRVVTRLRQQYSEGWPTPDGMLLTLRQTQRLVRYVMMEYGND